jgi:hypothetical protein
LNTETFTKSSGFIQGRGKAIKLAIHLHGVFNTNVKQRANSDTEYNLLFSQLAVSIKTFKREI